MATSVPVTRYAVTTDGLHIAYQTVGVGSLDVLFVPDWWNHVEAQWEESHAAGFLSRLASFSRLILFDKRGQGLSDPVSPNSLPILDDWMDDVSAVLDTVGSTSATLLAASGGGPLALLFAATHPSRVSSLVLCNSGARVRRADDYPAGVPEHVLDAYFQWVADAWGTAALLELYAPSVAGDEQFCDWFARQLRLSQSPGTAVAIQRMLCDTDVRGALGLIAAPTLVLHRRGDRAVDVAHSRYLAEHIAGARLVELPGQDHLVFTDDVDALLDEVEEFLTGVRRGPLSDRLLATVLFSDIVDSTVQAVTRGDRRWRDVLDRYDSMVDRQLVRYRGRLVKTTGDGTLASFDGPGRALECATLIRETARSLGLSLRIGIHTGEVERRGDDLAGLAVHIAARVAALANAEEILVSRTVADLVAGSGRTFRDRGIHTLKGVPNDWQLFALS